MLLEIATGTTRQLTDGSAQDQVINWAPDGKRFVFHSDRFGKNQLLTLTLDGAVQRLTTTAFDDRNGAWFPDGSRIAFLSDREGSPGGIFTMRADGTDPRRVAPLAVQHGVSFVSPDGRRVLASPRAANGSEIWAVDVANGAAARLVECEPTTR
jgi:Tol biopolymer transport system component